LCLAVGDLYHAAARRGCVMQNYNKNIAIRTRVKITIIVDILTIFVKLTQVFRRSVTISIFVCLAFAGEEAIF
jgi:predicted nucleotidyltransferase